MLCIQWLLKYFLWCSACFSCWVIFSMFAFPIFPFFQIDHYFWVLLLCRWSYPFCFKAELRKISKLRAKQSKWSTLEWHQENNFKANADKCHLFISLFSNNKMTIANCNISSSNSEELLGEVSASETTFAKHLSED